MGKKPLRMLASTHRHTDTHARTHAPSHMICKNDEQKFKRFGLNIRYCVISFVRFQCVCCWRPVMVLVLLLLLLLFYMYIFCCSSHIDFFILYFYCCYCLLSISWLCMLIFMRSAVHMKIVRVACNK